jgi:outer membrane receptor for ferrienterochelin and colicins
MKRFVVILLASGLTALTAAAQSVRVVEGTVLEKIPSGEFSPIPGATVATIGHEVGTQTDEEGKFSLTVADSLSVIVASFVGYASDTLRLAPGDNKFTITLEQPRKLKEVVVLDRQKSTEISMLDPIKKEKIGSRELLKAACCNLSESFETTPSVDVAFTDAISGYKQIQMLGLAGPYTLITRENIPDVRGLSAVTGLTFTPGPWIEGMQLSKGTGSVVNGYESVAGQINVEWKKPFEDKEEKWYFNLYQSSQGRSEANLVHREKFNEKLSTNIFLHAKSQWLKQDQNGDGFLDQPLDKQFVGANRWFWFGPTGWEIQGGIKGSYVENTGGQWDYAKGSEQAAGKPWGFELDMQRAEAWAKIGHVFSKPATSMGLQLSAVYHKQDGVYGNRKYSSLQKSFYTNLIYQSIIGNTNHGIKLGLSNLVDQYDETIGLNRYKRNEVVPGAFAEYSYNYLEKFNLVAGLRADYHNLFGTFLTPRLHVRYAPFKNTAIRASIGRAQRTANIFAENMGYMASNRVFAVFSVDADKAYGLDPEVAWNTGINLTQKFRLNYRDGSFSVDYYYTHFQNQVIADVEDKHTVRFYNLDGSSFANSFQAQFDYELVRKLDIRLAYRWYDVKSTYGGVLKEKPLLAAHRAFANIGYETRTKWKFDYTVVWNSSKRLPALHSHIPGVAAAESRSPDFTQMNAQISKSWNDKIEVYLGGENLTNYMQHDPVLGAANPYGEGFDASMVWGPVMGRNVYAGLRYKFR